MEQHNKETNLLLRPSSRLWIGAPALMVLACVTTQAAGPDIHDMEASTCVSPDLSWAVSGGVTHSADQVRAALAKHATFVIDALDRFSNTGPLDTLNRTSASASRPPSSDLPAAPSNAPDPGHSRCRPGAP